MAETFHEKAKRLIKELRELPEKSRQEYAAKLIADLEQGLKADQDAAVKQLQKEAGY